MFFSSQNQHSARHSTHKFVVGAFIVVFLLLLVNSAHALEVPQLKNLPGFENIDKIGSLGDLVMAVYRFALGTVGLVAFVMFIVAGIQYLISPGNPQLQTKARVCIRHIDSRYADIPAIDGVITSPPYVGLIDYHEQHTYGYRLLGLPDERENEIGPAVEGAGQAAREKYQHLIASVFRRAVQAMPSGGRLIVVAGDRRHLYPEIARKIGVEVEAVVQRHVNRRTGRRSTDFYESVFIWRVP
jgi:hypothetical protein